MEEYKQAKKVAKRKVAQVLEKVSQCMIGWRQEKELRMFTG